MGDDGLAAFEETLRWTMQRLNPEPETPIDERTARCQWLGERMDYSTAIEGLQFLKHGAWLNGERVEHASR